MSEKPVDEEKAEPKENDKCMENGEPDAMDDTKKSTTRSRMDAFSERAKNFTSKKHNVVIILLCIFAFILFIAVIALAVRLNALDSSRFHKGCTSSHCLEAAASVVSFLNRSVDPCTDFWSFSCNGWIRDNPLPSHRGSISVSDNIQTHIYKELRHAIDAIPQGTEDQMPEWKVKKFFGSCMNVDDLEYSKASVLKDYINSVGGWSVLRSFSPAAWVDRNKVLERVHSTYGIHPYFRITVEPDDLAPNQNIIKLYPDGLGLPGRTYYYDSKYKKQAQAYKQFMRDLAKQFGAVPSTANTFAENVWNYEKRIAEITPSPIVLNDLTKNYKKLTIRELTHVASIIKWGDIIQAFFPENPVQESTSIAVISVEYFKNISDIISSTSNDVLNDYVMWRLTSHYAQYLSKNFRSLVADFTQTLEGIPTQSQVLEERYKFCMKLTSKFLGFALGSLYVKTSFANEISSQVRDMIERTERVIQRKSGGIPWLQDESTRAQFRDKVSQLIPLIGYPEFITNKAELQKYYNELVIQNDFLSNIKAGIKFLHKKMGQMMNSPVSAAHSWTIYPQDPVTVYHYSRRQLVVAAGLLQSPIYDPKYPAAMKYGALGAILTSALMRAFDDTGISYNPHGVLQPWLSNKSMEVYRKGKDCLFEQLDMTTYEGIKLNANITVGQIIAEIGGVKMAYAAYKDHVSDLGEEENLITIQDNDDLFFVSYAQTMCENQRTEKVKSWAEYSTKLPNKIGVMTVLQQLPEFANSFNCQKGSRMNPSSKCYLW